MILPKDISESILIRESGSTFADDMSAESFSDSVEAFIDTLIAGIIPESSITSSPLSQDISEESLMKELEGEVVSHREPIRVSLEDVRRVVRK